MDAVFPTIVPGEAVSSPQGNQNPGGGIINLPAENLGSVSINDVLTLQFIQNISTSSQSGQLSGQGLPSGSNVLLRVENQGQTAEIPVENLKPDRPLNLSADTIFKIKITAVDGDNISFRFVSGDKTGGQTPAVLPNQIQTAVLPQTQVHSPLMRPEVHQPQMPQTALETPVINNAASTEINVSLAPLKLAGAVEQVLKQAGAEATPEIRQIIAALPDAEIVFEAPRPGHTPAPQNAENDFIAHIKNLLSSKEPVSQIVQKITEAFTSLPEKGMRLTAQTTEYPLTSALKTSLGTIFPEETLKLPPDIRLELPVAEVNVRPETKLTDIFSRELWNFQTNKQTPLPDQHKLPNLINIMTEKGLADKIPTTGDKNFIANLVNFIKAAKTGSLTSWLGKTSAAELSATPEGRETSAVLQQFVDTSHREAVGWRMIEIPVLSGDVLSRIRLAVRKQQDEDEKDNTPASRTESTRFIIESNFSQLGQFQFDGLAFEKQRRFDLIIRTSAALPDDIYTHIMSLFKTTLHNLDYSGTININFKEKFIKPWEDEENTVSRKGILA